MELIVIGICALGGAILTFFSGFGLGTLLLAVLSVFLPIELAIAATAVVHLFNNILKFGLLFKHIDFPTLLRFGLPALIFAYLGGWLMVDMAQKDVWAEYELWGRQLEIVPIKLLIGVLMVIFALYELLERLRNFRFHERFMLLGGALSGFFGGISGHQGALRSAFLSRSHLDKEGFIATSGAVGLLIDLSRLVVYAQLFRWATLESLQGTLGISLICAFAGTIIGKQLLKKTTFHTIHKIVGIGLLIIGSGIALGVL